MTGNGCSHSSTRPPRRRRLAAVALGLASASPLVGSGAVAHADQPIDFDDAGDAAHISLIGDSTLAGVRWYSDYGALRQFNFVLDAESCRRTIDRSCVSREGYRSANVIDAMHDLEGDLGELLVVMSGYNDPLESIDGAIAEVVDAARAQGVGHVVWLTLRTSSDVDYSDPQEQSSINTFREYNEQLLAAAEASGGFLQVADWTTYSTGVSGWFEGDGVHLTRRGVDAVTDFIAGTVARVLAGEDVTPTVAPWTVLVPGAEGDDVRAVQTALIAAGIDVPGGADGVYGTDTMIAVAAYQRGNAALRETGAVDTDTARALGVYTDADAAPTTSATPTTAATASPPVAPLEAAPASSDAGGGLPWWPFTAAALVGVLAAAVAGRRRYVVAQRAQRRWARVHPATSPRRSVADMRRAGELPPRAGWSAVYDHELEEPAAGSL